jgi:hypothetical protein
VTRRSVYPTVAGSQRGLCEFAARGTLWQQLQLWEFGRGLGMLLRMAVIFPLMMLIMPVMMHGKMPVGELMLNPMLLFPAFLVLQLRMQQKAIWTVEMMRPVSRARFYLLAGLGTGLAAVVVWAVMFLVIIGGIFVLSPNGLTTDLVWQFALMSGVGQLWVFSIGVWIMRYHSRIAMVLGFMIPMITLPILWNRGFQQGRPEIETLAVLAAVSCVLCAGIVWDAYRRWLRVEIG